MYNFLMYFSLFLIYSFIGWIVDIIGDYLQNERIVNRGFLIGPYCPIYGTGALLIIIILSKYSNDLLVLFIMSVLVCSILEYLTSYVMEKLFHTRWWDYKTMSFNINGRVCLSNSIIFGLLGVLLVYFINPFIYNLIIKIPNVLFVIILGILFLIFITDVIISFNIITKIKVTADNLRKDSTEEISKKVREILSNKSILSRRLVNAFPDFTSISKKVKEKINIKN